MSSDYRAFLHLAYNPDCFVCRLAKRYTFALCKMRRVKLFLAPWKKGDEPPRFVQDWYGSKEKVPPEYRPYAQAWRDGELALGEGSHAVLVVHEAIFGSRFGRAIGHVSLGTLRFLMWVQKLVTGSGHRI